MSPMLKVMGFCAMTILQHKSNKGNNFFIADFRFGIKLKKYRKLIQGSALQGHTFFLILNKQTLLSP
jgi:hypothetical protein